MPYTKEIYKQHHPLPMHTYTYNHTHFGAGGAPKQMTPSGFDQRVGEEEREAIPELSQEEGTISECTAGKKLMHGCTYAHTHTQHTTVS